jgi:peptidyl-prolyl cis-trans isomerase A (cyclophilin A)
MKPTLPALLCASALSMLACSKSEPEPASSAPAASNPVTTAPPEAPGASPRGGALASVAHPGLLDPSKASATAPAVFKAKFNTTRGDFVIEVHRDWSPKGADRFYNLVNMGFFDDTRFFRAIDGFMVQFGLSGDPAVNAKWQNANIEDDPGGVQSNKRGFVSFATRGPNTRTTQIFINYSDGNARLDAMHFTPFGQVVQGMDVVDSLYKGYGEGAPMGQGPNQGQIQSQGNAYLDSQFPKLDAVKHAEIVK